ncbi:uncharacterized protein LOC127526026 [Erpetoichthys calabaricus]|uniref:uncharacterized protein LOC127526026 n=1 Tax=Erpetoichthys calabaricus TaxID=27687 RepID=UPI0022345246|nr:uncharacterized protein LOC127526026 [Erpetoichthys calabaricus]
MLWSYESQGIGGLVISLQFAGYMYFLAGSLILSYLVYLIYSRVEENVDDQIGSCEDQEEKEGQKSKLPLDSKETPTEEAKKDLDRYSEEKDEEENENEKIKKRRNRKNKKRRVENGLTTIPDPHLATSNTGKSQEMVTSDVKENLRHESIVYCCKDQGDHPCNIYMILEQVTDVKKQSHANKLKSAKKNSSEANGSSEDFEDAKVEKQEQPPHDTDHAGKQGVHPGEQEEQPCGRKEVTDELLSKADVSHKKDPPIEKKRGRTPVHQTEDIHPETVKREWKPSFRRRLATESCLFQTPIVTTGWSLRSRLSTHTANACQNGSTLGHKNVLSNPESKKMNRAEKSRPSVIKSTITKDVPSSTSKTSFTEITQSHLSNGKECQACPSPDYLCPLNGKSSVEGLTTQELFRNLLDILDIMIPERYPHLLEQVEELIVDTQERLEGVVNIIFKRAISERQYSAVYAGMCHYLLKLDAPTADGSGGYVNFRFLLLKRCQKLFYMNGDEENEIGKKQEEIEAATQEIQKQCLCMQYEEIKKTTRLKSLGNIVFIGQLFKWKVITGSRVHQCIAWLLSNCSEESLERLCLLLTTVGKQLDLSEAKIQMDQYFSEMNDIIKAKKVSSRIQFLLQDVLELRQNKWMSKNSVPNKNAQNEEQGRKKIQLKTTQYTRSWC